MYLNVPEEGGATSFPKAFDGKGLVAKPPPGSAVLFYSMLPDGNGDDLSLHSGMEVTKGMKYVCNLWACKYICLISTFLMFQNRGSEI